MSLDAPIRAEMRLETECAMKTMRRAFAALLLGASSASPASAETRLDTAYDFFVGGLKIAEMELSSDLGETSYDARSNVQTRGILELIIRGRVAAHVEGNVTPRGILRPETYVTDYTARTGARTVEIGFEDGTAQRISIVPPEEASDTPATPVDARERALDPLSGAVAALLPRSESSICNRTIPIFDGARRYDVIFLEPTDESIESGAPEPDWPTPLLRCLGIYERIAGFPADTIESERYFPFDIWFERRADGRFLAMRIAGKTRLGPAIGNLRRE